MSPGLRTWLADQIEHLSARTAVHRRALADRDGGEITLAALDRHLSAAGAATTVAQLDRIIADYGDRIARADAIQAGCLASTKLDPAQDLQQQLARIQPYELDGVTLNDGPIMSAVRAQIGARLAALRGEPAPAPAPRRPTFADRAVDLARQPFPPMPAPFAAGPQLGPFA